MVHSETAQDALRKPQVHVMSVFSAGVFITSSGSSARVGARPDDGF